ncbi:hypothetical protein [Glutamicibacter sp. AOP5-A2-18]|uniref:hypothetical protein n=1 Tax=Glutamicibacter sp. AOP5-A2-18 TaxID=3457656 RepID=UPI0040348458
MVGSTLFAILLIVLAFVLGQKRGRSKAEEDNVGSAQLREAWQQGYEAAQEFLRRSTRADQGQAPPDTVAAPLYGSTPQLSPSTNTSYAQPVAPGVGQPYLTRQPIGARPQEKIPAGPIVVAKPVKVLTKRERELRNINITLYVAALMIVAAGALFLSFALPPVLKLVGLFLLAAVFYVGGLLTHAFKSSLKPAGAAFAGTGMALLPLGGIATYNTLDVSGPVIWFVFSAISTLAVGYATIRFKSRVLAWVAVLILVSTSMAGAAMLQRGMLYYLLFLLALSVVLLLLAVFSDRVRNSAFYTALSSTAQLLPALVGLLALVLLPELSSRDYLWIFFLLTGQLLLSVKLLSQFRLYRLYAARLSFMLMLVAACDYAGFTGSVAAITVAVALAIQGVLVLRYAASYRQRLGISATHVRYERGALWALALNAAALSYFLTGTEGTTGWISYVAIPLLMTATIFGVMKRSRVETLALPGFALIPILDLAEHFWRPLPSLALGILALSVIRSSSHHGWNVLRSYARWVLLLSLGGALGGTLWETAGKRSDLALMLSVGVGLTLVALGYWVLATFATTRGELSVKDDSHRLIRLGGSALVVAMTLVAWRITGVSHEAQAQLVGISSVSWFTTILLLTAVVTAVSGWWLAGKTAQQTRLNDSIRGAASLMLLLTYSLSFNRANWYLALVVGTIGLLFFLLSLRQEQRLSWKIRNATFAQVLFSTMVWWFVDVHQFDIHGRYVLLLLSLVVPQLLRLVRNALKTKVLSQELQWIATGLLILEPVSLFVYMYGVPDPDRGALLLAALLWAVHGATAYWAQHQLAVARQLYMLPTILGVTLLVCIPAMALGQNTGWIRSSWWTKDVASVLLLLLVLVATLAEWRLRTNKNFSIATGVGIFVPAMTVALWQLGTWSEVLALLLVAVVLVLFVVTRRSAWYAIAAGVTITYLGIRAVKLLRDRSGANALEAMDLVWVLLAAALVFYLLATAHGRWAQPVPAYPEANYRSDNAVGGAARLYFAQMMVAGFGAGLIAHSKTDGAFSVIGGAALILAVATATYIFELPEKFRPYMPDALFVLAALLGLSSYAFLESVPQASTVCLYLCAIAVVLVIWRNLRVDRQLERIYLISAATAASLSLIFSLMDANPVVQILALIFFAALVAWSLKQGDKLLIWWGAIAMTVAVLWFLRELAFLWLVIIGLGLIVAAVFKLVKVDKANNPSMPEPTAQPQQPAGAAPVQPGMPWMRAAQEDDVRQEPTVKDPEE